MKAIDIFKAKDLTNVNLEKTHLEFKVNGELHKIEFSELSVMEALLLRMQAKIEVLVDTSTFFEESKEESAAQQAS